MQFRYLPVLTLLVWNAGYLSLVQGEETFAPTRLEWVTTVANATYAQKHIETLGYSVHFGKGPVGSNAVVVATAFDPRIGNEEDFEAAVNDARRGAESIGKTLGWNWLKVMPRKPPPGNEPSEGDEPYTPTRLDWLSLEANIISQRESPKNSVVAGFAPGPQGTNTIILLTDTASALAEDEKAKEQIAAAQRIVEQRAGARGWDGWIKTSVDSPKPNDQPSEGDRPYELRPVDWVASLANLSLAVDAWETDGFRSSFHSSDSSKDTIVVLVSRNPAKSNSIGLKKEADLMRSVLERMVAGKGWDWIKVMPEFDPPFPEGGTPQAHGNELIELSRLQYLAMTANMTLAVNAWESHGYSVIYSAGPKSSDTIYMIIMYRESVDRAALQSAVEVGRRSLSTIAELNGWGSWLRIEVIDKTPKLATPTEDAP